MKIFIDNTSLNSVVKSFAAIANKLINEYVLVINNNEYQFIDIEFYYFCYTHIDGFTMIHEKPIGQIEAHKYGVDISLGNKPDCYGGILIKSLLHNNKVISKSKIKNEIINGLQMNENIIKIKEKQKHSGYQLIETTRDNLGVIDSTNNRTFEFKNAKYRFIVSDRDIFSKISGKEKTLKSSDLSSEQIQKLLGYNLQK
jgi:hypothetical protein